MASLMPEHPSKPHAAPGHDYQALLEQLRQLELLTGTLRLLRWDQQVCMPAGGTRPRAGQAAEIARLLHTRWADPALGERLEACEASGTIDVDSDAGAILSETRRRHERARRLPATLVIELAEASSTGFDAWRAAREANDFTLFHPALARVVELVRRKAECLGWPERGEAWDVLVEEYEPGCTAEAVATVFDTLTPRLNGLLDELRGGRLAIGAGAAHPPLSETAQHPLMRHIAECFGFDFTRGRLDATIHPFCTRIGHGDVRLTIAYRPDDLGRALGSLTHETGHGLYEQGLPEAHAGTPLCQPASLGLHEGQARLWENHVGRSRAFSAWCAGELRRFLGRAVGDLDAATLFAMRNEVAPGPLRTEADELTYHLHVATRFELERALLDGTLSAAELPEAWDEHYRSHLGIEPSDDVQGCMQDVHWSVGMFGYFPSYTFGSLYAAQLFEAAEAELGELASDFEAGRFCALRQWLAERVWRHGRRYPAAVLCERATGAPLSIEPLLRHLAGKLRPLYRLER